jgi:Fe-S-cluster-containing hydrogenase component 2
VHVIDQSECIHCGMCFEACPPKFGAIERLSGSELFAVAEPG